MLGALSYEIGQRSSNRLSLRHHPHIGRRIDLKGFKAVGSKGQARHQSIRDFVLRLQNGYLPLMDEARSGRKQPFLAGEILRRVSQYAAHLLRDEKLEPIDG